MPKLTIEVTPEKITEILRDLSPEELKQVLAKVADRLEAREWMRLEESSFQEWLAEPDLYENDRPSR